MQREEIRERERESERGRGLQRKKREGAWCALGSEQEKARRK